METFKEVKVKINLTRNGEESSTYTPVLTSCILKLTEGNKVSKFDEVEVCFDLGENYKLRKI